VHQWERLVAKLPVNRISVLHPSRRRCLSYHARAGKRVPAETDAIPVFNVAPLVLERLKVGHAGRLQLSALIGEVWGG
jgi:hypothetical protein